MIVFCQKAIQAKNFRRRDCLQGHNAGRDKKASQDLNVRRIAFAAASAALLAIALCACQSLKRAASPVTVFDARICESPPESGWQGLGVEFVAVNLSGRPVQNVQFYASAAQRQDAVVEGGSDNFASDVGEIYEARLVLQDDLDVGEERTLFVQLEDLDDSVEADDLEVECVRAVSAAYEDGELWPSGENYSQ